MTMKSYSTGSEPIFSFDQKQGKENTPVGKRILVGITHYDANDNAISNEQFYGIIERFDAKDGITIQLNGSDEKRTVPLDATTFQVARLGKYTLTGTGEVVEDPDYTMRLAVYPNDK